MRQPYKILHLLITFFQLHSQATPNENNNLLFSLSKILGGPLGESSLAVIIDQNILNSYVVLNLIVQHHLYPKYFIYIDNGTSFAFEYHLDFLNYGTVIFIPGSYYEWLDDESLSIQFQSILVLAVTSTVNTCDLLKSSLIQRSRKVALLEMTNSLNDSVAVYSSRPMMRSRVHECQYKFLLSKWNEEHFKSFKDLFPERFQSFHGEVLEVASDNDDFPFVFSGNNEDRDSGVSIKILDVVASKLNFTYSTTTTSNDTFWGEKINDSWNGLLGSLFTKEKNLTVNYFTITIQRAQDFEFSYPYFYEGFGFALRIPLPQPAWLSLTYPLSKSAWIALFLTVLCVPIFFYFVVNYSNLSSHKYEFEELCLDVFKSLMKQSVGSCPKMTVGRMCFLFWWLGAMIIVTSYTANLVAVLTIPVFPPKIKTLPALANSDLRIFMANYGEFVPEALKNSEEQILKALGKKLQLEFWEKRNDSSIMSGILEKNVISGKGALLETYSYLLRIIKTNDEAKSLCYMLDEQIYSGPLVFFFPKYTPWHHRFQDPMKRLFESGIISKWHTELMKIKKNIKSKNSETTLKPLALHHLQGIFIIILLGFTLSIVCFILELVLRPALY